MAKIRRPFYFLQIGTVANRFDMLLQWNDFIVTSHHCDGAKFKALGEVHGADRQVPATRGHTLFILEDGHYQRAEI